MRHLGDPQQDRLQAGGQHVPQSPGPGVRGQPALAVCSRVRSEVKDGTSYRQEVQANLTARQSDLNKTFL